MQQNIIIFLLGVIAWFFYQQIGTSHETAKSLNTFKIEIVKAITNSNSDVKILRNDLTNIHDKEVKPNTERSKKNRDAIAANKKNIDDVRRDVNYLKIKIK